MDGHAHSATSGLLADMSAPVERILDLQGSDGAIPWFKDGPWDPWNHVESAMALTVMGAYDAANAAFDYLVDSQRPDGAWLGEYGNALPMVDRDFISRKKAPSVLDTNFCAYPAVGIAHLLLSTGDLDQARERWPMVRDAISFVVSLQRPDGTIPWAFEAVGTDEDDALLAGNASIAKSLECAIFLAQELGEAADRWITARGCLIQALRHTPHAFDHRGSGARFAMDWYYPVLSGAMERSTALSRLERKWDIFVTDQGCRCVADEPWITVAETSELVLALLAVDQHKSAERMFQSLMPRRDDHGVFWMGWQTKEQIIWPREQPSWTQAAVILAADALASRTPASRLLTHSLLSAAQKS
ncbi:MAG: prenyltransferase [Pseudomonadota bacterium]